MKIKCENFTQQRNRLMAWHTWFAWHPVFCEDGYIWLETVYRRANEASWDGYGGMMWEYTGKTPNVGGQRHDD